MEGNGEIIDRIYQNKWNLVLLLTTFAALGREQGLRARIWGSKMSNT